MKKTIIFIGIIFSVATFLIYSCSKENFNPELKGDFVSPKENSEIIKEITTFSNKMKSNLKSSKKMQLKKAIWLTEATLNYYYGVSEKPFDDLVEDSSFVQIPISSDKFVYESDVILAYNKFVEILNKHFKSIKSVNKHMVVADIAFSSENSDFVSLKITSSIGTYSEHPHEYRVSDPFDATDYWWWARSPRYCTYPATVPCGCGPNINQPINNLSDGAKEITKAVNWNYAYFRTAVELGTPGFFTDIEEVGINEWGISNSPSPYADYYGNIYSSLLNPDDDMPNDNWYDRIYFYSSECNQSTTITHCTNWLPYYHDCMNPNEMNFYYNNYAMYRNSQLIKYPNLSFIKITVGSRGWDNTQGLDWLRICHTPMYTFGKSMPIASVNERKTF